METGSFLISSSHYLVNCKVILTLLLEYQTVAEVETQHELSWVATFVIIFLPTFIVIYSFYIWMRLTGLELKKLHQYRQPFDPHWRKILIKHFQYYQLLYPSEKKKFEKRVQKFIINKTFVPKEMDEVTIEMKVMIAASAVQLTFGLTNIHFEHFAIIEVYPHKYYSKESSSINLGEVQLEGKIVLSWKDFVKGYKYPDQTMNIGLHEMAHALELENKIPNGEFGFLNPVKLDRLKNVTKKEITKIRNGEQKFLRKYAGTNDQEFFAVSVEYFFEQPHQLKKEIPELYDALASLLNQDPIKRFSV